MAAARRCAAARTGTRYAGGKFEQLRHATARAVSLGYRVRGGYAVCPLVEDGRPLEAAYWLGDDYPDCEAVTGSTWCGATRTAGGCRWREVGPVAWSEGERMAAAGVRGPVSRVTRRGAVSGVEARRGRTVDGLLEAGAVLPPGTGEAAGERRRSTS